VELVKIMVVRGMGIRDISAALKISIVKALKTLKSTNYKIKPKQSHYDCLEADEFGHMQGKSETKSGLSMRITGKAGKLWCRTGGSLSGGNGT
jgi:hypothetical protein